MKNVLTTGILAAVVVMGAVACSAQVAPEDVDEPTATATSAILEIDYRDTKEMFEPCISPLYPCEAQPGTGLSQVDGTSGSSELERSKCKTRCDSTYQQCSTRCASRTGKALQACLATCHNAWVSCSGGCYR